MSFELRTFRQQRPFLFHLTACRNVPRIRQTRRLESAASLFDAARRSDLKRKRRRKCCLLKVGVEEIHVRDQSPLHRRNMALDNLSFEEFVEKINENVFFWPGTKDGPIAYGRRHFWRYRDERPRLIRLRTEALVNANPDKAPLFCRYNSGSPRWSGGKPSPRGSNTFLDANSAPYSPSNVVEFVYNGQAFLPEDAELGSSPDGPWERFFPA